MKICGDNIENLRLNVNGNFKDITKKNNNTYYYHEECEVCKEEFLSKRKEAVTCCRSCTHSGERNGRHGDHRNGEELVGKERADEGKRETSERFSGDKNPNTNGNHGRGREGGFEKCMESMEKIKETKLENFGKISPHGGLTYEEYFGEEKAESIKNSISDTLKEYFQENGLNGTCSLGFTGWYKDIFFRSGMELSFIFGAEELGKTIKSAENSEFSVSYINIDNKERNYYPDFYLVEDDEIIEIKSYRGVNDENVVLKAKEAIKVYGDRYKILTEYNLKEMNAPYIGGNEIKNLYEKGDIQLTNGSLNKLYGGKENG